VRTTTRAIMRRVPWTCRWGRFGGQIDKRKTARGFVFWTCTNADGEPRVLARDECEDCPFWEPVGQRIKE